MFNRASAGLSLSPAERAFLRLVEGLILSALIAGLQAVMPLLNSATLDAASVPWASVGHTFIATVLGALGAAVVKYAKAQGDGQLSGPAGSGVVVAPAAAASASPAPAAAAAPAPAADGVAASVPPIVGGLPA